MTYECKVYDKNGKLKKVLTKSQLTQSSQNLFNQSSTKKISSFINRFKEPSSYAALAGVLAMVGISVPVELWQNIVMLACGASGVIGFFMSETHDKKK